MVAASIQYDPQRHITAAELRDLGFYISEWTPDEAYVRRVAVGLRAAEPLHDGSPTWGLRLLEPFIVPEPVVV